ncbi:PREDICTED: neuroblastoma-amplified sequence [Thamnophis sirtalis]|uniref:Neuroblastoma-amplified sequence n=1 Tax=Thamnophis sirtalis TaxID=35019 RepID=A0A6I9XWZ8_9SAUR|nr:PREDICTED: neuroblastoma-amplified sequence [Thamnophis sirtalis]
MDDLFLKGLLQVCDSCMSLHEPTTQIFTESLLCSSLLENIHLAGQMMHCNVWSIDPPVSKGKIQYRISYEKSIELVLAASREYFNSSTSLTDTCMDLARSCLQLITDCPSVIQEELDLIRSLSYFDEFGVKILPLQVRLCSDRLSLIKECLSRLPTNYKQSAKLLGLANLLKVAGNIKHDFLICAGLSMAGYCKSWEVCSQLGQSEGYQDMEVRQQLLAYALTYCPPSAIEMLLAASNILQTEVLYNTVNYQIRPSEKGENVNISRSSIGMKLECPPEADNSFSSSQSADLLQWTTAKTMKVLSNTTLTTKAVLHAVSDRQWWKKSIAYLRPLHGQEFGDVLKNTSGANAAIEKQGCHPFYETLIDNPYLSDNEITYTMYEHAPLESFAEVLLRTGKLAETKSEGHDLFPATEANFPQGDIKTSRIARQHAHTLILKAVTLAYTESTKGGVHFRSCDMIEPRNLKVSAVDTVLSSIADPKDIIQMVTKHVTNSSYADWPEEIAILIKHLQYYNERLLDFTQAQILQGLGKGVDVQRFTADGQYKRETILGLADLSTVAIEDRAKSLGLFETLKTVPKAFHEHMTKYVYPIIEGKDHQRLLYYFTLLENCVCSEFVKDAIKLETHIRLLKKFKAVAPGLNYKKLTEENADPLEALDPILTCQNILPISKLAPKIPGKDGRLLSPSSVYAAWIKKLFWNGDSHLIKRVPETPPEWLHAYDVCAKYFDRLYPGDIINFLDEITFSSKAVTKLSVDSRVEMTKRAIKSMKHSAEKAGKRASEGDLTEGAVHRQITYEDVLNHLQQSLAHLETLSHSFISYLKTSDQKILQEYGYQYDISRSEKKRIHEQVVTMCLDGQPLNMIKTLLDVAVGDLGLSPRDVVETALIRVIAALSEGSDQHSSQKDHFQILEDIVSAVHASAENGENMVSSDDLLAWLRPYCGDDSLPVKPRIRVLQILEQAFHLSDEDSKLLILFRTQAVLKAYWPQTQVEITEIENEEKRYFLFMKLLENSRKHEEFQHLVMLLQAWPPMKSPDITCSSNNLWVKLGTMMLTKCLQEQKKSVGDEILAICRSLYETKQKLSAEVSLPD